MFGCSMYLVQWAGFAGKEGEYSRLDDSDLDSCYDSLDGDFDDEPVHNGCAANASWCVTAWFVCIVLGKPVHRCTRGDNVPRSTKVNLCTWTQATMLP